MNSPILNVPSHLQKSAVIKQEGEEWILYTKDGKRILGRHKDKQGAIKQEYAIQKSMEKTACTSWAVCSGMVKSAAIPQKDLRYWGEVNDAVAKKVKEGLDPTKVGVIGSCGHSIRKGPSPVKIGKKCFTCLKADDMAPLTKISSWSVCAGLRRARNETHTHPTPAQAHEGNYRKGEFSFKGLTIKLENPKGTQRTGYKKDGTVAWTRLMHADYGYFKGTKAVDGDAVDCFVGPDLESDLVVAIDQYRGDKFDETKFVLGVKTQEEGEKLYLRHYPKTWKLGPVSTTTVPQLKTWLSTRATKKPFKGQQVKAAHTKYG